MDTLVHLLFGILLGIGIGAPVGIVMPVRRAKPMSPMPSLGLTAEEDTRIRKAAGL